MGATVILSSIKDSTQWMGAVTDAEGLFYFRNVSKGKYRLKASYISHNPLTKFINVDQENVDLGTLKMSESIASLEGVTVEGKMQRVQILGDSLQFNAEAFKTNPDANVEDLVTKMPGITSQDGELKVNGEKVQQILVDGKPFFGEDPNMALKNLPAQVVDKIQVFDRQSEQSQFTGFDDGETLKTINIVTRPGMNNGVFGKLYGGYGSDDRYTAGGNINSFKGDRRISIVGITNNINQQNFSTEDLVGAVAQTSGRGRSGRGRRQGGSRGSDIGNFLVGSQGGISTTHSIGLNYNDVWGSKIKLNASYFFNKAINNNNSSVKRTFITAADSALIYNETKNVRSQNDNHRFNLRFEYDLDSSNFFVITPKFSWQDNSSASNMAGIKSIQETNSESRTENLNISDNLAYNFSNNLLYRRRFEKKGRTLSLSLRTDIRNKERERTLNSLNQFTGKNDSIINQNSNQLTKEYSISSRITYTEPIGKTGRFQINYSPTYKQNRTDKKTRNFNSAEQEYLQLDTALSNDFGNTYTAHKAGLDYNYNNKKVRFSSGVDYEYSSLIGDQTFPSPFRLEKSFQNLLPQASFNYKFSKEKNLRIRYRTSTDEPSVSQLQNVVDNANPLFLKSGNPNLKQEYSHDISFRYNYTNAVKATSLFLLFNTDFTQNYIANATIMPSTDSTVVNGIVLNRGTQLTMPVNLDGYLVSRSFFTYAFPVTFIKSNLNLNTGFTYNRTPALINNQNNLANNYNLSQGLVIGSNISENIDFNLSYTANYSIVKNTIQKRSDNNYFNQHTSLKLNLILWKGLVFNSNLDHLLYTGLSEDFNQSFILWNASLGYKFLKDRSLELKASVFDILDQNNSISRNVTETYIEDEETTILRRYFLLTLSYNIRSFKKE